MTCNLVRIVEQIGCAGRRVMSKVLAPRLGYGDAWHFLALTPVVFIAVTSSTMAQERLPPEKRPEPTGIFLHYLDAPDQGSALNSPPRLFLSFGKARFEAVMDTGSTGVLITAAILPNWASLPSLGSARLIYSSSGRIMEGVWVLTPMIISDQSGASVKTRPMAVMVVNRVRCVAQARDCTLQDNPRDIAILGVGFARHGDGQLQSTPDRNPFLQILLDVAGLPRPGYVLTRSGVNVGLDRVGAYASFTTVQLARSTRFPD